MNKQWFRALSSLTLSALLLLTSMTYATPVQPQALQPASRAETFVESAGGYVLETYESHVVTAEEEKGYNVGKLKVTGTILNQSAPGSKEIYSLVAEGFDEFGNSIETRANSFVNLPIGSKAQLSVYFSTGERVKNLNVFVLSGETTSNTWEIVSYADRIVSKDEHDGNAIYDAGKLKIQAVIRNGMTAMTPPAKELYTMVAEGYDARGKCIEVAGNSQVNIAPGFTGNTAVLLNLGSKIKSYKLYIIDGEATSGQWDLAAMGSHVVTKGELSPNAAYNIGALLVDTVVKSGMAVGQREYYTLVVKGLDAKGNCIEIAKNGQVNIGPGFTANNTVFMSLGSKIASVEAITVDGRYGTETVRLVAKASRILGKEDVKSYGSAALGKLRVTVAIKSELSKDQTVKMTIVGYDAKGKVVDSQGVNCMTSSGTVSSGSANLKNGVAIKSMKTFVTLGGKQMEIK